MINSDITVSVVILTYNHERYIAQALESILSQKVDFRYEILIGDDASKDETPEILRKYQELYPEIIRLTLREENIGATRNAYELLRTAQGRYIAACEGDDYWCDDNKLQKQVDFLDSHPQYIGCAHACRIVDENGKPAKKQRLSWTTSKQIYTLKDFKGICLPGQTATILRRNIYSDPGSDYSIFTQAHKHIGDRTTTLIYAAKGDFYCFREIMSCYRRQSNRSSLTSNLYTRLAESLWNDLQYTLKLERYAVEELHVDAGFRYHKRNLLTSAVFCWIRGEHDLSTKIIKTVIGSEKCGWCMLLYIPIGAIKKIYARIKYY